MDDERSLSNRPEPDPRSDAAEAFLRLSARVEAMEQRQDARLSMLTCAVEHIAIEKQSVEFPDYTPTLAKMNGHLATLTGQMKKVADAPAMQLAPESMAAQISEAAQAARDVDRATICKAHDLHHQVHGDQMRAIGAIRTKQEQRRHMLCTGIGTALAASLLWLVYPGWAANIGPQGWQWPERVACRTLGEPTLWDAGIRLMRTGDPEGWQAIVDAADMRQANRDAIAACERAAANAKRPVRCTVMIGC